MSKLVSRNQERFREVELLGKDEKDPTNGGNHPWSLEDGNESTLLLFNHSAEPESFSVSISNGDQTWQKVYELSPMQTEAISFSLLIQDQSKDDRGKTLPRNSLKGQVTWFTRARGVGKGRLLLSNQDLSMARNFSCTSSIALCGVTIYPGTQLFTIRNTVNFGTAQTIMCDVTAEPVGTCGTNGAALTCPYPGRCHYNWTSYSPSVASISGSSTTPGVSLTGNSAGTSTIGLDVLDTFSSCQRSAPYATATVEQAIPTNWTTMSESNLNDGSLFFQYTWSSTSGYKPDLANCIVGETVFYPSSSNPYVWPPPMVSSQPNPFSPTPYGKGSDQLSQDTNYPPDRYQQPYFAVNFNATQRFWWSCPYWQNGDHINFVPDITITRRIFKDTDGFWKYQITKSGQTNTVKLPGQ